MNQLTRLIVLAGLALAAGAAPLRAQVDIDAALSERVIGDADAPVTIVEYASMTCPHCATFHNDVLDGLAARYIDTGKARLVFRDFPLDGLALRASALARCAPDRMYFRFVDVLFDTQARWSRSENPVAALEAIGRMGGLTPEQVSECLASEALLDGILRMRQEAANAHDIRSTPTFVINGETHSGVLTVEEFADILEPLLAN